MNAKPKKQGKFVVREALLDDPIYTLGYAIGATRLTVSLNATQASGSKSANEKQLPRGDTPTSGRK